MLLMLMILLTTAVTSVEQWRVLMTCSQFTPAFIWLLNTWYTRNPEYTSIIDASFFFQPSSITSGRRSLYFQATIVYSVGIMGEKNKWGKATQRVRWWHRRLLVCRVSTQEQCFSESERTTWNRIIKTASASPSYSNGCWARGCCWCWWWWCWIGEPT